MDVFNESKGQEPSGTLIIGVTGDKPLVTVKPVSVHPKNSTAVDRTTSGIDRLSPLLQAIPSAAVASEVAQTRLMEVVINGPLAKVANGEGFRAFNIEGGRIREHATLFEPERLQNLVNSAALFQIASVVVAQKHLADISAKLDDIKAGIDAINAYLSDKRRSEITGALKYLGQVAVMLHHGEMDDAARAQLEFIERELGGINDHLVLSLEALKKNVDGFDSPGLFDGSSGLVSKLGGEQGAAERLVEEWKLCMSARWVACSLLRQITGQTSLLTKREEDLNSEVHAFFSKQGPLERFNTALDGRIDTLSSVWEWQSTIQVNRIKLRQWNEERLPKLKTDAQSDIQGASTLLLEREANVTLTIEMRDGELIGAYQH
ncbi:hypothetical protein ALQ04_02916 [Pseudomonas cichorii]|uniref:Uncharacterized protein n=1 Tax=Pseudomonas cichorii TaxID=36746 RepID=A0A3M4MB30_PSECI|nr:hypothetical protein [Pseudomonas cichorii]RMQ50434.1 hypothetical protein ALQ04_02916 [Pseudomonas cichorii]